jgi:hypothetical protein
VVVLAWLRKIIKIILSTIFQPSPYSELVNLLLNFCKTHMSSQIMTVVQVILIIMLDAK